MPDSPTGLDDWLGRVPAHLQSAVRQRVHNGLGALPGLALTPYLIGLLVMLGMLGTFLGMVVTFKGAVFALEGSADLGAIRGALAAPIKGLGLSFGTSVAGVASSAMLGLMSAVARRERSDLVRQLDRLAATTLRPFTAAQRRDDTFAALQSQASALPQVVSQLQALLEQVERRHQQLDERLSERQDRFHREATAAYTELGRTVALALNESLSASARAAGESLQPVVVSAMAGVAQASARLHEQVHASVQQQLVELSTRFETGTAQLLSGLQQSAEQLHTGQAASVARLIDKSESLVQLRADAEARWAEQQGVHMGALAGLWRSELEQMRLQEATHLQTMRADEAARGQAAVQRLDDLQGTVTQHLATLGSSLEAPITRLLQTASEAPRAAAEVIRELRQEMSRLAERDRDTLHERGELMQQIGSLLQNVQQTTAQQRDAIESLVASATTVLNETGARFAQTLQAQAGRADEQQLQMAAGASALSGLGAAFGQGVQQFNQTSEQLVDSLQQLQAAISQSMVRSDEQLAYYVAQAREVVDLSISAQQGIVEDLRQLRSVRPATARAVAPAPGAV